MISQRHLVELPADYVSGAIESRSSETYCLVDVIPWVFQRGMVFDQEPSEHCPTECRCNNGGSCERTFPSLRHAPPLLLFQMVPYSEKIQDWYVFLGIWCFRPFGSEAAPSGRGLKTDGDDSASTSTMSKKVILGLLQQKSNDLNQCQCKNKVLRQTIRRQREK